MRKLLKGNYDLPKTDKEAQGQKQKPTDKNLEKEFEAAALKKLGGSITFVKKSKSPFVYQKANKDRKENE